MENVNKTPEATGKGDWDWNTAPVQLMEARQMAESPDYALKLLLRGGMASSESADRACASCVHYYKPKSHCIGCIRKYM